MVPSCRNSIIGSHISITLREAQPSDMLFCGTLVTDWIDQHDWLPRMFSAQEIVQNFTSNLFETRSTRIAQIKGTLAGFSMCTDHDLMTGLHVAQRFRNQGVGKCLMDDLKAATARPLELWVHEPNKAAQRFYRREGFEHVATDLASSDEGLDELCFRWHPKG